MLQEKAEIGIFYVVDLRSRCHTMHPAKEARAMDMWGRYGLEESILNPAKRRSLAPLLSNPALGMPTFSKLRANGLAYA